MEYKIIFSLHFSKCYCVGFRRRLVWNWRLICLWLFLQRHHADAWTLLALNCSLGFMKYKYPHPKLKTLSWFWLAWVSQDSADSRSVPTPCVCSLDTFGCSWDICPGYLQQGQQFILHSLSMAPCSYDPVV